MGLNGLPPRPPPGGAQLLRAIPGVMLRRLAGVAEWQTRQTQNLLSERTWEFKSPRPHQRNNLLGLETTGSDSKARIVEPCTSASLCRTKISISFAH